jgi:hypothetical protein
MAGTSTAGLVGNRERERSHSGTATKELSLATYGSLPETLDVTQLECQVMQQTRPGEVPFEEPAGEPPPEPSPFWEPCPGETPERTPEPQPAPSPPECPPEPGG